MSGSRLVYSTDLGRICPDCGRPVDDCVCPKGRSRSRPHGQANPADGVVRVRRESKGRSGKTATTVQGLRLDAKGLEDLAGRMKRKLGTGGGVHDGVIVIQGDRVEQVMSMLRELGHTVKRSGG